MEAAILVSLPVFHLLNIMSYATSCRSIWDVHVQFLGKPFKVKVRSEYLFVAVQGGGGKPVYHCNRVEEELSKL